MSEFKRYHPIVNLAYFAISITFSCLFFHPVTLIISLISGFIYFVILKGKKAAKKSCFQLIPLLFLTAVINPAFNHKGITILIYLPTGNPLTLESIYYGILSAIMIISIILQFSCFNEIMTSDKFTYLFGKILPTLSLIFSMVLRFVPSFINQFKNVADAQKCIGKDIQTGKIIRRIKNAFSIFSIMITKSLENAIDTADSMKSRGYGLPGRTAFSIFTFTKRDFSILSATICFSAYIIIGKISGQLDFKCFPFIQIADISFYTLSVFVVYFLLLFIPISIELSEARKWKYSK